MFLGIVLLAYATPGQAASFKVREQQVLDLVVQKVMQRHQIPRQDVEVEWLDTKLSSMVTAIPEGPVTLEIADTARLNGKGNVPVSIFVNGKKFRTIFPKVSVNVYQTVLVTSVAIARGSQPQAGDVTLERRAIGTTSAGQPLSNLKALAGAQAVRDLPVGTVLTAPMFRIPPVVKMGDVVTVMLVNGDLTMITSAQARTNGSVGQVIRVMNLDSKREFTARVVGPNRVEVKLED